jgi:CRP-like cAMP-binding protein
MATLFYEDEEYPSEITAESAMRIAVLPKELVEDAFEKYPEFAKAYAVLLSQKIHFLNEKLSAFSEGEAHEKLLRWILSIADGRDEFDLPCSVSKLASMVGIGRASVYRAFDQLTEEGKIIREGKKIKLIKP